MERFLQIIIRQAVMQLTRQGISGLIYFISNRASRGKFNDSFEARDEHRQEIDETVSYGDAKMSRQKMRMTRRR